MISEVSLRVIGAGARSARILLDAENGEKPQETKVKLFIDNHDRTGPSDYTEILDAGSPPKIRRALNQPSVLEAFLVGELGTFVVPRSGSKIWIEREDGTRWFTGTIDRTPQQEWVGRGLRAAAVRYAVHAITDEISLDRTPMEKGLPIAEGDAAETLRRWTLSAGGESFDTSSIAAAGTVKAVSLNDGVRWSEAAAELANSCRAAYVAENNCISLRPIGMTEHELDEAGETFIPEALRIEQQERASSDLTVVGEIGPGAYVKDYFVGDGHTMRFPMSQQPFLRPSVVWLEEEYARELSSMKWSNADAATISTANGKLVVEGGTGIDGSATLSVGETLELGGCIVLEHGAVIVNAASDGIVGGLYDEEVKLGNCIAGFAFKSDGAKTNLQAVVSGTCVGTATEIIYGHRYELITRLYASEVFRVGQSYRWSGGEETADQRPADVRFVMEIRDLYSGVVLPAATVIYEGVVTEAPALAIYSVVNAGKMHAALSYTRVRRMPTAEVRTTSAADGSTRTRIVGLISDGAECSITTGPAVYFYVPNKPANGDQIVVRYRAAKRTAARVYVNEASADARTDVVRALSPMARTDDDCQRAAMALLKDSARAGYQGSYATRTDLLKDSEIIPGDSLHVKAASRAVEFTGVIREVEHEIDNGIEDRAKCRIAFSEDGAEPIAIRFERSRTELPAGIVPVAIGDDNAPPSIGGAEVVEITSTSVRIDAGADVIAEGGIEVRREGDFGWGEGNDRNLIGRFTTRSFTVPRSTRGEDYYLRMFDGSAPKRYSQLTTLLHVDVKDESI
jgi:hypothetical protein